MSGLIDEEATYEKFGYYSTDFKTNSTKRIIVVCPECFKVRNIRMCDYSLSKSNGRCAKCSQKGVPFVSKDDPEYEYKLSQTTVDEEKTFAEFGYYSIDLSKGSRSKVYAICIECGKERLLCISDLGDLCKSCMQRGERNSQFGVPLSDEHKLKLGIGLTGKDHRNYGKKASAETCAKISLARTGTRASDETRKQMSIRCSGKGNPNYGKIPSHETRCRISAGRQHIPYEEWDGFYKPKVYCEKFNESCKESNREKYDRRCFICGKSEDENGKRLSVHHVDMNKNQGCDEVEWKLIPVCVNCHGGLHSSKMESCITYILNEGCDYEWN